jgi:hypothetical protein
MRSLIGACVVVALALGPPPAQGDERFRITYERDRAEATAIVLRGSVSNEGRRDVVDVYVTAEALNASGKVVATGITFVSAFLPQRGQAPFVAKIPQVEGVQSFRVSVSGFREAFGSEAP